MSLSIFDISALKLYNTMKKLIFLLLLGALAACSRTVPVPEGSLSEIAPGYAATSVNTAVFRKNSVVSRGDTQYVAFYDPDGRLALASRRYGTDDWTVVTTQYRGRVADAHNVASIGVDGDGYLHVAFDHHGDSLHYARSVAPGSLELGPLMSMVGTDEADVTYPEFHRLPDGSLLFAYRAGFSGGGNMVLNCYDLKSKKWKRVHTVLLDGEGDRNAYWQMYVDPAGTLHLSWVWRESWLVETNHDLCYARSIDGGRTWQRSDGTPYVLPITAATAETAWPVPQNSELINQTSMTADASGRPLIATYWRDANDSVPQYRLVFNDGNTWQMSTVGERTQPFSLSGGGTKMIPISRPQVAAYGNTVYYIFRDAERGSRVSLAYRYAPDDDWKVTDLTDFSVDAWEPSFDTALWNDKKQLDIFVQCSSQGDGERTTDSPPTMVSILSVN